MHDARWFEQAGLPACALVSDGFVPQARYQASILDADNVPQVFVAHPISDQTREQLHAKADLSFEQVYKAMTQVWTSSSSNDMSSMKKQVDSSETEVCST